MPHSGMTPASTTRTMPSARTSTGRASGRFAASAALLLVAVRIRSNTPWQVGSGLEPDRVAGDEYSRSATDRLLASGETSRRFVPNMVAMCGMNIGASQSIEPRMDPDAD